MNRFDNPQPRSSNTKATALYLGLVGMISYGSFGCQILGGLEDLVVVDPNGGAGGTGGSETGGGSASSSSSSSSGVIVIVDVDCGGSTCTVGAQSACCSDHYKTNSDPFVECVSGPPGNDGCNTAGGANGYETRIKCQWPSHCPTSTVCCANTETISVIPWFVSLSCTSTCNWPDTNTCDPMAPMNECPMVNENGMMIQTTCQPDDLLPSGYFICKLPTP